MELSYEEIQMELDLRGSELNMKRAHYRVLETYGFARKDTLSHWGTSVTPVKARDENSCDTGTSQG